MAQGWERQSPSLMWPWFDSGSLLVLVLFQGFFPGSPAFLPPQKSTLPIPIRDSHESQLLGLMGLLSKYNKILLFILFLPWPFSFQQSSLYLVAVVNAMICFLVAQSYFFTRRQPLHASKTGNGYEATILFNKPRFMLLCDIVFMQKIAS